MGKSAPLLMCLTSGDIKHNQLYSFLSLLVLGHACYKSSNKQEGPLSLLMWVAWMGCTTTVWKCWTGSSKSVIFSLKLILTDFTCSLQSSTQHYLIYNITYILTWELDIGLYTPLQRTLRVNLPKWSSHVSPLILWCTSASERLTQYIS